MKKGLALYCGYKLSEKEMINIFFDENFRKYIEDVYKTKPNFDENKAKPNLIPNFDENNKVDHIDSNIRNLFEYYHKGYFFGENDCESQIKVCCTRCCMYDNDSDWVIGIQISQLPAFKNKISKVDAHIITPNDIFELNKINEKFKLHIQPPSFYSIPMDCWCCS